MKTQQKLNYLTFTTLKILVRFLKENHCMYKYLNNLPLTGKLKNLNGLYKWIEQTFKDFETKDTKFDILSMLISFSFSFALSNEGFDYWSDLHEKYQSYLRELKHQTSCNEKKDDDNVIQIVNPDHFENILLMEEKIKHH